MLALPSDIHNYIVQFLDKPSLLMLSFTNKQFKSFGKKINIKDVAKYGYLEIMKYLKYEFKENIFSSSVNNLELLKWLKEMKCPWNVRTFDKAASYCDIETLQWLKDNECPWDYNTFIFACGHNNVSVLEWLNKNKCPIKNDEKPLIYAVSNGKLDNVIWLHAVKFSAHSLLIKYACISGNIQILDFLYENKIGYREHDDEYLLARINGHSHVCDWLDKHP
jgi:hypothetical protein